MKSFMSGMSENILIFPKIMLCTTKAKYITLLEIVNMANAQNNVNMKKYNI